MTCAVERKPRKPKTRKTASASATPKALALLESYLEHHSNRKRATKALLGCSDRTAARIASRSKPYRSPMKMEWVSSICYAVGRPVGDVLGMRRSRSWSQCILGWSQSRNADEALQFATDCGLSIVYRALVHYQLSGKFTVDYAGGYPREVVVYLSPTPDIAVLGGRLDMHQIVITSEPSTSGGKNRMMIQHVAPGSKPIPDKNILTPSMLDGTLALIYARTKNITTALQRETARAADLRG